MRTSMSSQRMRRLICGIAAGVALHATVALLAAGPSMALAPPAPALGSSAVSSTPGAATPTPSVPPTAGPGPGDPTTATPPPGATPSSSTPPTGTPAPGTPATGTPDPTTTTPTGAAAQPTPAASTPTSSTSTDPAASTPSVPNALAPDASASQDAPDQQAGQQGGTTSTASDAPALQTPVAVGGAGDPAVGAGWTPCGFRATVTPLSVVEAAGRTAMPRVTDSAARATQTLRRATARHARLARELIFAGADGMAGEVTVTSPPSLDLPDQNSANTRHHRSTKSTASVRSSVVFRTTHGARAPQGGMQTSSGGGGAVSPLAPAMGSALVTAPRLRVIARPAVRLLETHGHRLERPG